MPYIYDTFTWSHCAEDYWTIIEQMSMGGQRRLAEQQQKQQQKLQKR
jgi:hypothetical protein